MTTFQDAVRRQESLLALPERKALRWLACRMPRWIHPDHLTLLGFAATALAGLCYAGARWWAPSLPLVNLWLAVNWFGDSLDGTLARVRGTLRPRYGFYVDHMVDAFGAVFLIGGLATSGLMSERVAVSLLVAFLLLAIHTYLATYTDGRFQLSIWQFGPTELRILLIVGNCYAYARPVVRVFGRYWLFFDVAGTVAAASMFTVLVAVVARQTVQLYRAERI
ncbi:MAG: CDP-alcohol phosphatidyltransferase family protein [Acidobacteriia bacterium]|nr:CDP-alcohol phosphatidyltransferase family protein [Terriglobia bacterium]